MILIIKGQGPKSLIEYSKQKCAHFDGFKNKDELRQLLLAEQGHICAYCMCRIKKSNMKIEHWYPESYLENDPQKLEYSNMLGCCNGHDGEKNIEKCCDTSKGNQILSIDPRKKTDIDTLYYDRRTGEIKSTNTTYNKELNEILNLNSKQLHLPLNRKNALDGFMEILSKTKKNKWTVDFIKKKLSNLESANEKLPYCGIIIWYLKNKKK